MPYTVQVRLDGENVRGCVEEIWRWIDQRQVKPPMFQYRMTAADVALRLDFDNLSDASKFSEAFNGLVIGLTRADT